MISHCGFDWHFPDDSCCWAFFFHVFVTICMSSLGKCLFRGSAHLLIGWGSTAPLLLLLLFCYAIVFSCMSSLCILHINCLSHWWLAHAFSHCLSHWWLAHAFSHCLSHWWLAHVFSHCLSHWWLARVLPLLIPLMACTRVLPLHAAFFLAAFLQKPFSLSYPACLFLLGRLRFQWDIQKRCCQNQQQDCSLSFL